MTIEKNKKYYVSEIWVYVQLKAKCNFMHTHNLFVI
jgi:hypothetical protein